MNKYRLEIQVSNQKIVHPLYTINSISSVSYCEHSEGWGNYEDQNFIFYIKHCKSLLISCRLVCEHGRIQGGGGQILRALCHLSYNHLSYNHLSYNHLSNKSFVLQIICPTNHLSYMAGKTSFVLHIICPTPHLSCTSFVLHLICPTHHLSYNSFVLHTNLT